MSQEERWEEPANERICITGGTGFIGSHLYQALPQADLFKYPAEDLRCQGDAYRFIARHKPAVVFHLAAQSVVTNTDDLETLGTNIVGTYNLLHACRKIGGVRSIVHISTDKVYGSNANARRTDMLRGVSEPYAASKNAGDVIAQMYANFYDLPIHIVRTGNIYGPGDKHLDRLIPGTITDTLAGKVRHHRGDRRFIRDFIYVQDVIWAYLRIANEPPGIYNLGGEFYPIGEVVQTILRLMGREDLAPVWENSQKNEIPFQHVTDCPAWWQPGTGLEDGLRKTIAWYSNRV